MLHFLLKIGIFQQSLCDRLPKGNCFAGFLPSTVSAVAIRFPHHVLVPQALNGKVAHEQIAPFFGLPTVVFCVFVWKIRVISLECCLDKGESSLRFGFLVVCVNYPAEV